MSWLTPKTDWNAQYGISSDDYNRIEGNIVRLRSGLLEIAGTEDLDIGSDYSVFKITGNFGLKRISNTNRLPGEIITLIFWGSVTIHDREGDNGNFKQIIAVNCWDIEPTVTDIAIASLTTLQFVLGDNNYWYVIS